MRNILLVALIFTGLLAVGQDKKATGILNDVAGKTRSYEQIKIEFEYKMINKGQGINESIQGVLLSKGDKYKVDIAGQQVISDGKTVWTFLESVNEVQINEPMDDETGFNPRSFLENWSDNFKAKLISETRTEAIIDLTPIDAASFNKARLVVDTDKKQLISMTMYDGNGNEFVYSITKFITNIKLSDKEFTFSITDHPGVEVIDLR